MQRIGIALTLAWCALALSRPILAADPEAGRRLVAEKQCENCHHSRMLGDAKAIYLRRDRKVTSLAKLKAQVAACNSQLNLQLFPEEEEHIVAYLDQAYYKFGSK